MAGEEFLTSSIDDYLIAIADGLHDAQARLARAPVHVVEGQQPVRYQIPKLEFELKMHFGISTHHGGEAGPSSRLRARPVGVTDSVTEAASTLRGSFVAVPIKGGRPATRVTTNLRRSAPRVLEIAVVVESTAGERRPGVPVEFNLDDALAATLNPTTEDAPFELQRSTALRAAVVKTNAKGQAATYLEAPDELVGCLVPVRMDIEGRVYRAVYAVEAS